MNSFISSHDAERKLRILICANPFVLCFKKNLKRKRKKTAVGLSTSLSAGCFSELINPDGNWYDQNSVPSTLEYTWNIVKPT